MLDQEKVMELKIRQQQGQSLKEIARESGVARNTVRKYVRDQASAVRQRRASRLDAHRDWLMMRMEQAPRISSAVLQRELLERGA
jgi:transposase